jgi:predicted DNA-binding transcriptional regulator AlpA
MKIERFVTESEATKILSLSRTTLWKFRRSNQFPQKYRLSNGCYRYRESDLISWWQLKMAA